MLRFLQSCLCDSLIVPLLTPNPFSDFITSNYSCSKVTIVSTHQIPALPAQTLISQCPPFITFGLSLRHSFSLIVGEMSTYRGAGPPAAGVELISLCIARGIVPGVHLRRNLRIDHLSDEIDVPWTRDELDRSQ